MNENSPIWLRPIATVRAVRSGYPIAATLLHALALWLWRANNIYLPGNFGNEISATTRWLALAAIGLTFVLTFRAPVPRAAAAVYLAFLTFFGGVSTQYLLWPLPFLPFALNKRWAITVNALISFFLFVVYTMWSGALPWNFADSQKPGVTTDSPGFKPDSTSTDSPLRLPVVTIRVRAAPLSTTKTDCNWPRSINACSGMATTL